MTVLVICHVLGTLSVLKMVLEEGPQHELTELVLFNEGFFRITTTNSPMVKGHREQNCLYITNTGKKLDRGSILKVV